MTPARNTVRTAPTWLKVLAGLSVAAQTLALIFYLWGVSSWEESTGGGFAGHHRSLPQVLPGINVAIGASVVVIALSAAVLAERRYTALVCASIGLAASATLVVALYWTLSISEPEPGLGMLFYELGRALLIAQGLLAFAWFAAWLFVRAGERSLSPPGGRADIVSRAQLATPPTLDPSVEP